MFRSTDSQGVARPPPSWGARPALARKSRERDKGFAIFDLCSRDSRCTSLNSRRICALLALRVYSHSKAPFLHSYMEPTVETNGNVNIVQGPNIVILFNVTARGNGKLTSGSGMINNVATE